MAGWLIFLIAYFIFLVIGFSAAFLYRKYQEKRERKFFDELIKIRAHIYTQINVLIQAYGELMKLTRGTEKVENLENQNSLDLGEASILAQDVQTNLTFLKTELEVVRPSPDLALAKEGMIKIIGSLNNHIISLLGVQNSPELLKVLEDKALEQGKKELKKVNKILKDFMKDRGIKGSNLPPLDWLIASEER